MKLEHSFTVPADVDTVWQAVVDPERVAPCMPGATLAEVDGASFKGSVKVKLGPISLLYKGSGEFLEQDEQARRLVIKAAGKDARGNGTASATVTLTLADAEGGGTAGSVHTDLSVTGKPAQFGRGMISEVGGKILESFADCLGKRLSTGTAEQDTQQDTRQEPASQDQEVPPEPSQEPAPPTSDGPRLAAVPDEPESEPINLVSYAGPTVAKRAIPVLAAVLVAVLIILRRRRG